MTALRIEHKITDFEGWKKVFDSDPIDRKNSGVKRYYIYRPIDDPHYVIIDLFFDNSSDAETALGKLRKVWGNVEGTIMFDPKTLILNIAESFEY